MGLAVSVGAAAEPRGGAGSRASWPAAGCCSCTTTTLLSLVDAWLTTIPADTFVATSAVAAAYLLDLRARRSGGPSASGCAGRPARRRARRAGPSDLDDDDDLAALDPARVALVGPVLRTLMGVRADNRGRVRASRTTSGCGGGGWCSAASSDGTGVSLRGTDAGDRRRAERALRRQGRCRRRAGVRRRPAGRGTGRLGPERGPLAGRHPELLSLHRGAGDAGRRHRTARPAPAAAGAGDAGGGRAGRAPGRHAALAAPGHAGEGQADRADRWCARWWRTWSSGSPSAPGRRSAAR